MNKMQGSQDSMTKHFFDCNLEMIDFFNITDLWRLWEATMRGINIQWVFQKDFGSIGRGGIL